MAGMPPYLESTGSRIFGLRIPFMLYKLERTQKVLFKMIIYAIIYHNKI